MNSKTQSSGKYFDGEFQNEIDSNRCQCMILNWMYEVSQKRNANRSIWYEVKIHCSEQKGLTMLIADKNYSRNESELHTSLSKMVIGFSIIPTMSRCTRAILFFWADIHRRIKCWKKIDFIHSFILSLERSIDCITQREKSISLMACEVCNEFEWWERKSVDVSCGYPNIVQQLNRHTNKTLFAQTKYTLKVLISNLKLSHFICNWWWMDYFSCWQN